MTQKSETSKVRQGPPLVPSALRGTWLGGFLVHCCFIPLWVGCVLPPAVGAYLLLCGGWWTVAGLAVAAAYALMDFGIHIHWRPWFMRIIYELDMAGYYKKCKIVGAVESIRPEKTLFMFHPHGILSVGFVVNGVWSRDFNDLASAKANPGIQTARPGDPYAPPWEGTAFLIARNLREWTGFFKLLADVSGRLESATKERMSELMRAGRNVAIIPGGFEDATLHAYGKERTAVLERKGLVKYALQHGYAVTPIYTFGESETYRTLTGLLRPRLAINQYGIPTVAFWGEPLLPAFPIRRTHVTTCVGPPLQLPKLDNPRPDEVNAWHARYLAELRAVFDKHKAACGKPDVELEIW